MGREETACLPKPLALPYAAVGDAPPVNAAAVGADGVIYGLWAPCRRRCRAPGPGSPRREAGSADGLLDDKEKEGAVSCHDSGCAPIEDHMGVQCEARAG